MPITISPTESDVLTALRAFILMVLPAGIEVVQAQDNRVPEPEADDFVVMTPMFRERLETNVDSFLDTEFTGAISGATMTVETVAYGAIAVGSPVFGVEVADGTYVIALGSGAGGAGTYTVTPAQTIASGTLAAGVGEYLQPTRQRYQLDVHGPNSADNASIISTLFRDDWGATQFLALNPAITPLHADDPKQLPFVNGEQQIENRWVIDATLQVNETTTAPQDFFTSAVVGLVEVDAVYPPH